MNTIIVEDELKSMESLQFMLKKYCPEIEIKGLASSALHARELLISHAVDLVFLDIGLPDENGFEFLESVPRRDFIVIVVTASHEHALRAIKASAIDYLLKPIHSEELKMAVTKAKTVFELKKKFSALSGNYQTSLSGLIRNLTKGEQIKKITLPYQQGFVTVPVNEIKYLKAEDNYTLFFLAKNKTLIASRTLKDFEDALDERNFVRVHKSYLVNLSFLQRFDSNNPAVILEDDVSVPVSRRRIKEFNEKWKAFSGSGG